jgi:adenine-specific DNA-methyltransferase
MPILHWLNRDQSLKEASRVPYRLLEADPTLSYGDTNTENMLIQGDNLEALKALLPYYAGKVKCIFIDPPYNTKSAFEHYDDNLEHTKWLEMMYPRLELLWDLLADDGSIWITIDDNEAHYLKVLVDNLFGRKNFVANMIWEKNYAPKNDARWFSDSHDHTLVFAKNKDLWRPNLLDRSDLMKERYKNPDNDPRGVWTSGDLSVKTYSASCDYPITTPAGRVVNPPAGYCWRVTPHKYQEMVADNRIWFASKGDGVPRIKRFLSEVKQGVTSMTIFRRDEVGDNQEAKREIKEFNMENVFSTPKPERLLQRVLHLATNEGDLVLDSFLGSGTTAAVAHKMGRRYIGIEIGNHAITHCLPRLQKVIEGEQGGISKTVNWQGGGGVRFYRLGQPIFNEAGQLTTNIAFKHLAAHIWFSETRTPWQPQNNTPQTPLLGVHNGVAYYLLYNGILGDKRPQGGNVLTSKILATLPPHAGAKIIYGETSRLGAARLQEHQITFKQTPYDVKAR